MVEVVLDVGVALEHFGVAAREARLEIAHLRLELAQVRRGAARVVVDAARHVDEQLLLEEADARAARDRDVARVRVVTSGGDAEQR
jgi:hypothetical protein